jgi:hypothetical protein
MNNLFRTIAAAAAMTTFVAGAAMAQSYPESIVGTWTIRANDTLPFTFTVSSQSSDAPCAVISGLMGAPNDTIAGYYCPATGEVSFLRNSSNTGATYQVFTGNLSWTGGSSYMTGSFSNFAGGNDTGAYGFTAYASVE